MNRKIAGLVFILMIFLSNNVLAANLVHVAISWFGQDKMYVDTESVFKIMTQSSSGSCLERMIPQIKRTKLFISLKQRSHRSDRKEPWNIYSTTPKGKKHFATKEAVVFRQYKKTHQLTSALSLL